MNRANRLIEPAAYAIIVEGPAGPLWPAWFEGLVVEPLPNGQVCLSGSFPDQPALHGILERIRDLNMVLVAVKRL